MELNVAKVSGDTIHFFFCHWFLFVCLFCTVNLLVIINPVKSMLLSCKTLPQESYNQLISDEYIKGNCNLWF